MRHGRTFRVHAVAVTVIAGLALAGIAATGAGAQTGDSTGVTDDAIKLGYISSQTGIAASTHKNAHKSCGARVDAENAKGGVNGRKIDLETIDDGATPNLNAAQDLVTNRNVFAVIDNSAFATNSWRYLKDQGVPMIGGGFDGSPYYEDGMEAVISGLGTGTPVPGLTYDTSTRVMKQMGAKKVAAVGYGISPSSSESAKATETYGAKAQGLKGVYLNNTVDFGTTDVTPLVLAIKNSGADALYLPLDADTNFAIVQTLQQNGVKMKANILATGYSQDLLDQPIVNTITPNDVMFTAYRPVELGGKAVKQFRADLKKYGGLTGVPDYGTYTGYIICDMAIEGLKAAGKDLTRESFVDGVRGLGKFDGAGLTCAPIDVSLENYQTVNPTSCTWFVTVKDGKFEVLNGGKPEVGKLVGDPALISQYSGAATSPTTTTTG